MENKKEELQRVNSGKGISFLEIIAIFLKNKKRIFIITGIVCVISIILYFFVFDLIYFSSASIKSSTKSSGLLSSLETSLPDIGDLGDFTSGGKSVKDLATYEKIITSRRCLEPLIVKFKLMERDKYVYMEDAIRAFEEGKLEIKQDKVAGILVVGIYDKNPQYAKEMVEFLLQELDKINIDLNITQAKNNREFIEKRYFQAREDLKNTEDSLKSFQMVYGISPDLQIKAAAQSAFTLEAEMKAEEVKLDVMKKILSADQPEVKTQEATINALKEQLSKIQNSTDLNDFLRLGNSPTIAMSFYRLQREVEIQNKILTYLLPVYEQSKIEEKKETPTITILDNPYIAERKSKPKRLTMVVIFTFLTFMFSSSFYIFKYKWYQFKKSDEYRTFSGSNVMNKNLKS